MDKVHEASNLQCDIPPSESYRNVQHGFTFRSSRLSLQFLLYIFLPSATEKNLILHTDD